MAEDLTETDENNVRPKERQMIGVLKDRQKERKVTSQRRTD